MEKLLKKIFISIPFKMLWEEYLLKVIENKVNPEIALDNFALDNFGIKDFEYVAQRLHEGGLSITLHAPYMELAPGGIDPKIRSVSLGRLHQAFDFAPIFKPFSIVCHSGYDNRCYRDNQDQWLKNSIETWTIFADRAREIGTILMIENVFEETPEILKPIFKSLYSDNFKFCFDVGHAHVFGKSPIDMWIDELSPYLGQLHLHDNKGEIDDHMALGCGEIEFEKLFSILKRKNLKPIITLEAHQESWVLESLQILKRLWPW
ncbi:MAG TPA: sugar phosphate isomerase/epimerase [Syntrophaceae bacterium]|nr:sugar phosphate isomerase/epimerase [Syntrophaceae bacterium]